MRVVRMRAAFIDNTFIFRAALHMRNGPRFTFHWKFSRAVAYCNAGIRQQLYDRYTGPYLDSQRLLGICFEMLTPCSGMSTTSVLVDFSE